RERWGPVDPTPPPRTPGSPRGAASGAWWTRRARRGSPGPWSWRDRAGHDRRGRETPVRPPRRSARSCRHHAIVERAHPGGAAPVVLEELLARWILEALGKPRGDGSGQIQGVGGPGAEETQVRGDPAEEAVVRGQGVRLVAGKQSGATDRSERAHGMRAPDRRMPLAMRHLYRLGDELHVDQSSSSEFDVQPSGRLLAQLLLHAPAELPHLL